MPSWLLPGLVTVGITLLTTALGVIWLEIKTTRRELREDMREMRDEYRSGIKSLNEKLDRFVESLVKVRQP